MRNKKGIDMMVVLAVIFGLGIAATSLTEDKSKPYANQTYNERTPSSVDAG